MKWKVLYRKWDRRIISKFPKWFRVYAPIVALAMLTVFDVFTLYTVKLISGSFNIEPQDIEILLRTFLWTVLILFSPKQLTMLWKKVK